MSSTSRPQGLPAKARGLMKGITTMRTAKTRFVVIFTALLLTAVLGITTFAVSAASNPEQAPNATAAQPSGYIATAFNDFLGFFGFKSEEAKPAMDDNAVQACFQLPAADQAAMVGWYPLENGTGGATADIAGTPQNGTVVGAPVFVAAKVNQGMSANGAGDYVELGAVHNVANGTTSGGMAIDAWVNPGAIGADTPIVAKWGTTQATESYWLGLSAAGAGFAQPNAYVSRADGTIVNAPSSVNIPTGTAAFSHVAMSYNSNTGVVSVIVNGVTTGSSAASVGATGLQQTTTTTRIAADTSSRFFPGIIDEVEIFDRAVPASTFLGITTADSAGKCHTSTLDFSASTGTVGEPASGSTPVTFTINRTGANDSSAAVVVTSADGPNPAAVGGTSCTTGVDYISVPPGTTVTFAPGAGSGTFTVAICSDNIFEVSENFTVSMVPGSATGGATIGTTNPSQVETITNNTTTGPAPTFTIPDVSQAEGNAGTSIMSFPVTRSNASEVDSVITFSVTDGSTPQPVGTTPATGGPQAAGCTAGIDYLVPTNLTVTYPAAGPAPSINITICGDTVVEPDQTFTVTIVSATNGNATQGDTGVGTILNDDTSFTVTGGSANEGNTNTGTPPAGSTATFTVTRLGNTGTTQRVDISTIPTGTAGSGTATSGAPNSTCGTVFGVDYITDGKTLVFGPGDTVMTFTVAVCGDTTFEKDETIVAQLTNAQPQSGGNPTINPAGTATWTIINDDSGPVISVSGVSTTGATAAEGNPVVFRISQNQTAGVDTTVSYTTSQAGVGSGFATECTTAGPPRGPDPLCDYLKTAGTATIPAGQTFVDIPVTTYTDNIFEGPETFTFTISNPGPTLGFGTPTLGTSSATGTITDTQNPNTFAISDVTQNEGNGGDNATTFNFTITRTVIAQADQTVCYSTFNGNSNVAGGGANQATGGLAATGIIDYTTITNNCVTFTLNGPNVINVPVVVNGDMIYEADETFSVVLQTINGGASGSTGANGATFTKPIGLGTILNDDARPLFTATVADLNGAADGQVDEGTQVPQTFPLTPINYMEFDITRSGSQTLVASDLSFTISSGAVTAGNPNPATAGTSCTAGVDYIIPTQGSGTGNNGGGQTGDTATSRRFAPSTFDANGNPTNTNNVRTVLVGICPDALSEPNETLQLTVTGVNDGTVTNTGPVTGTIRDDDAASVFTMLLANDPSVLEGNAGQTPPNQLIFTISRTGNAAQGPSTVCYNTDDGSATVADNDYVPLLVSPNNCVTFQPGDNSKTVAVNVVGDNKLETDENMSLRLISVTNGSIDPANGSRFVAVGTIINDDGAPTFAVQSVTQAEGTTAGATPGTTNFVFRITRTGQSQVANTVNFAVSSATNSNAEFNATGPGTTCANSNNAPTPNTPTAGLFQQQTDFLNAATGANNTSSTATFGPGSGTGAGFDFVDVIVPVCADAREERDEQFLFTLSATPTASVPTTGGQAVGTIVNDDALTFGVTQQVTGNEGNDPLNPTAFVFTVTRTGDTNITNSTVTYTTSNGSTPQPAGTNPAIGGAACGAGIDYISTSSPAAGSSGFVNTQTTATGGAPTVRTENVTVSVCGDTVPERDETFTLTVTSNNTTSGPTSGVGTIVNDDGPIPSPTPTPTPTPVPFPGFEGDINRTALGVPGTGDGDVNAGDQIQYQRFLSGTDCPAVGTANPALNEQQRLDAGPRTTLGDGLLGGSDGTAIDAYARHDASTDFDPNTAGWQPTPAGGPTTISNLGCTPTAAPQGDSAVASTVEPEAATAARSVRLVSASGRANTDVFAEVEFEAQGNEAAIQYSIHFDPAVLSISNVSGVNTNPDITLGQGAPAGTSLNVNAASAATGDISVGENFNGANTNPPTVITVGTKRITRLKFHILPGAALGASPVTFTNTVVNKGVFDANGFAITTPPFTDGNVTVTGARTLKIGSSSTRANGTAIIPVSLTATGSEFGVSLTANFDPTLLSITGVAGVDVLPGATALPANCTTTINNTGVAQGRIGIGINCPTGGIPAGVDEIFKLKFRALPAATPGTQVPVTFGNTPINTEVGDNNGNQLTVDKVSGVVTILSTTAARVSISGRVTTPEGNGLRNATVTLTDAKGVRRTATTSSFGFYQFDDVEAGATYVMGVRSRSFRFSTRSVSVTDNITDMDFVGLE